MMRKKITLLMVALILTTGLRAQQTGSFDATITFMGQSRTLSCYVPADYNPDSSYQLMIGLHGLGDNSTNYRNALINSLNWQTIFQNTIFIFPDGGEDANSDFYGPAGDEAIIDSSIAYASANYSIDSGNIILQGFSLGGRSALAYGLDKPDMFKGLLLNTPAIQGLSDAVNKPEAGIIYNYDNASDIPIYITVGSQDIIYVYTINSALKMLKKNDGKVKYVEAPLGHTVPGSVYTAPAIPFFESPTVGEYNVDIFEVETNDYYCSSDVIVHCYVQNQGSSTISSIEINYEAGGQTGSYTWTDGDLEPYEHTYITLPAINMGAANGAYDLELTIGDLNGSEEDTLTEGNSISKEIVVNSEPDSLPVSEGFEDEPAGWSFPETGSLFYWYRDSEVKKSGDYSIANFNTILLFNTAGNIERFLSPSVNLGTVDDPRLSFDLAFNYHRYAPPVFMVDTIFSDTLEILISTDCGETYESLYKKSAADLATTADPILNALSIQQCFFYPDSSEWRKEVIDLGAYAEAEEAIIQFRYISGMGGSINIDNINIAGETVSLKEQQSAFKLGLYPNPAQDELKIDAEEKGEGEVVIYDVLGKPVLQKYMDFERGLSQNIDVSHLKNGIYQVEVTVDKKTSHQKLLIRR